MKRKNCWMHQLLDPFHFEMLVAVGRAAFSLIQPKKMQSIQWTRTYSTDKVSNLFEILSFVRRRTKKIKQKRRKWASKRECENTQKPSSYCWRCFSCVLYILHKFHSHFISFTIFSVWKWSLNNKPICSKIGCCTMHRSHTRFICHGNSAIVLRYHFCDKLSISWWHWLACLTVCVLLASVPLHHAAFLPLSLPLQFPDCMVFRVYPSSIIIVYSFPLWLCIPLLLPKK